MRAPRLRNAAQAEIMNRAAVPLLRRLGDDWRWRSVKTGRAVRVGLPDDSGRLRVWCDIDRRAIGSAGGLATAAIASTLRLEAGRLFALGDSGQLGVDLWLTRDAESGEIERVAAHAYPASPGRKTPQRCPPDARVATVGPAGVAVCAVSEL